jgi:hypothetical protein
MKNREARENKRVDEFVNDINAGGKPYKPSVAQDFKPDVVKDVPIDMGRHGSDDEEQLNPEE